MRLCVAVSECVGAPQAALTGSCELPEGGAGTRTWVLWKNSVSS